MLAIFSKLRRFNVFLRPIIIRPLVFEIVQKVRTKKTSALVIPFGFAKRNRRQNIFPVLATVYTIDNANPYLIRILETEKRNKTDKTVFVIFTCAFSKNHGEKGPELGLVSELHFPKITLYKQKDFC